MKKIFALTLMILFSFVSLAQVNGDTGLNIYIDSLYHRSTKINPNNDTIFLVCDRVTGLTDSKDKKLIDNDIYKLFRFIIQKASTSDLLSLTYSKYPNLTIYGYWGLILKKKKKVADKVYLRLKGDKRKIYFDSFGDLLQSYSVTDFMDYLNKYGKR